MVINVIEQRAVPEHGLIVADEIIELSSEQARRDCPYRLRRIGVMREDTLEPFEILTNNVELAAGIIAAVCKGRWQIELFFKALKQTLKIKTFVGTSANAVRVQIWTALIAMLVLKYLQLGSSYGWSLSNLAAVLRMNLFVHRDLWSWINEPFESPPQLPEPVQMALSFA